MKVGEVMGEAITIDKNRKLSDALELMEKNNISSLVVVDEGEICGIITDKDIIRELGSSKHGKLLPSSLHVSSAMSRKLITVEKDTDIREAAKLMLDNKISSIPVVDNGEIVGIVCAIDIIRTLINSEVPVKEIMSNYVIVVSPEDRVVHARRLMLDNNISRVIVVEKGKIVGILTEKDVVKALIAFKKHADKLQFSRIRNLMVEDVMNQEVITIGEDASVGEAIKLMTENGISGLPVTKDGKLVGIITKTDILKLYV